MNGGGFKGREITIMVRYQVKIFSGIIFIFNDIPRTRH
jgi:hypothetical protein